MIRIYGIKNCDTMKKAFAWCDANHISYEFHDYKKQGVPRDKLLQWCRRLALMMEFSSVIRRPVVENDAGQILVGFDPTRFDSFVR